MSEHLHSCATCHDSYWCTCMRSYGDVVGDPESLLCDDCDRKARCEHREMVPNNDPTYVWRCVDCEHVFGRDDKAAQEADHLE